MPTMVISVRGFRPDELLCDPDFVYVGRGMPRQGWKASDWGNPFRADRGSLVVDFRRVRPEWWAAQATAIRDAGIAMNCVDLYDRWLRDSSYLMGRLPSLRGKKLGCWCGTWSPGEPEIACHAVVLAKLADVGEGP